MMGIDLFVFFCCLDVQYFQCQGCCCQSGNFGLIVGWGDFYYVYFDDVQVFQVVYQFDCVVGGQFIDNWGIGVWCKCWIQIVDIKGQVYWYVVDDLFYLGNYVINVVVVNLVGVEYCKVIVFVEFGVDFDLYGVVWIDKFFVWCGIEYGVVVEFVVVGVGIGVSIEVYQCYFIKVFGMGVQQWQGNEVVVVKGEYMFVGCQQFFGVSLQFFVYFVCVVEGVYQIFVVYYVQVFVYIEVLWEMVVFSGKVSGNLMDCCWVMMVVCVFGGCYIEWYVGDDLVCIVFIWYKVYW